MIVARARGHSQSTETANYAILIDSLISVRINLWFIISTALLVPCLESLSLSLVFL